MQYCVIWISLIFGIWNKSLSLSLYVGKTIKAPGALKHKGLLEPRCKVQVQACAWLKGSAHLKKKKIDNNY